MQKVYMNPVTAFFIFVITFSMFLFFAFHHRQMSWFGLLLSAGLMGLMFWSFLGYLFNPIWTFDETGIQTWTGIGKWKEIDETYPWSEVKKIYSSYFGTTFYDVGFPLRNFLIMMKSGRCPFDITWFYTKDYLKVLSDVVLCARKHNPDVEIEDYVLEKIQ